VADGITKSKGGLWWQILKLLSTFSSYIYEQNFTIPFSNQGFKLLIENFGPFIYYKN